MERPGARELDEARYLSWFGWAHDTLGRELEASHAAAEAGYDAEAAGHLRGDAEAAARAAGAAPALVDYSSIALAEWACWAQKRFLITPADALRAGRQALSVLESSHSVDSAMAEVEAAIASRRAAATPATSPSVQTLPEPVPVPQPAPQARTQTTSMQPRTMRFARPTWFVVVAAMTASAVIAAVATAGIMAGLGSTSGSIGGPPATTSGPTPVISVEVAQDGTATMTLDGFPPDRDVYILVDDTVQTTVRTYGDGSASTSFTFPLGGHTVKACLDSNGSNCPASVFKTRQQ